MARPLDDTGIALLAAATRLLAEEGAGALTVRRIATEAGCSTMGLYSRFGGKDGIVEHLFIHGFEGLVTAMDSVDSKLAPAAELRACARAYRQFALDHATNYLVMFGGAVPGFVPSDDALVVAHGAFDRLVQRMVRGQAEGVLLAEVNSESLAEVVWATIHGFVMLDLVPIRPCDANRDELYELLLDQLVRGWSVH